MPEKHQVETLYRRFVELRSELPSDNQAYVQLSREFGYNDVSSLRRRMNRYMRGGETPVREKVPAPKPETYIYRGQTPLEAIPVFTGADHLALDECMITGDVHLPTTNFRFLDRMCRVADRHMQGNRTLLIVGDIINGDKDSYHPRNYPSASRAGEFRLAEETIDFLLSYFDEIVLTPGNHMRNRMFTVLDGDIDMDQAVRLLTPHTDRVFMSAYDYIQVTSGEEKWTLCHQYSYSPTKLVKANELAQKYQSNVISFHQHHTAIGRDKYNRYTIVDVGGHHDSDYMGYVNLVPNTMPVMCNSFVFMRNGTAHLLSPDKTFTDWSMWLTNREIEETR